MTLPFKLVDYIPLIGSVLVECVLIAVMVRRRVHQRFPLFFLSVTYDLLRELTLFAIALHSMRACAYAFWISIPVEYTIGFAVMIEAFRHTFQEEHKLSRKSLALLFALTALLVLIATFMVLHPDISTSTLNGLILTLDRSLELVRCGVLLFMWSFASYLGVSWRHHVWGIVFGLGMYAGISLAVAAIHATTGVMGGDWLARTSHFSYFGATLIWAVYLCRPEPQRGPLTLSELSLVNNLLASYRRMLIELRRHIP